MSQPGPENSQWDLTRVTVAGQVLTAQFLARPQPDQYINLLGKQAVSDVSLVDDATTKRYTVLKDDSGRYMAAPLERNGKTFYELGAKGAPIVVWVKFPAPPLESKTVSISIPSVGSFDGVPVTR